MNIREEDDGTYSVESASRKGKWYSVDPKKPWCDCPAYKFRHMKSKTACKHIKAVREYVEKTQQETIAEAAEQTDEILAWIEENGGTVDAVELIDRFGEEAVDGLVERGELLENKGRITILK